MGEGKKSGLTKAAAIFGLVFLVSLGLCGVNFLALRGNVMKGADGPLFGTAYLELFGMIVGACGLIIVGGTAIIRQVIELIDRSSTKDSDSIIEKAEDK